MGSPAEALPPETGYVQMTVKLRPSDAARLDVQRGDLSRAEFVRRAVLVFMERDAVLPVVVQDEGAADRLRGLLRYGESLRRAQECPVAPVRCSHGPRSTARRGRYCTQCKAFTDVDGFPVRIETVSGLL